MDNVKELMEIKPHYLILDFSQNLKYLIYFFTV